MNKSQALRRAHQNFLNSGATFPMSVAGPSMGFSLRAPHLMRFDYRAETLAAERALHAAAEAKGIDGDTAVSIAKIESDAKRHAR